MTQARPRFELTRVYSDGTNDAPEIVALTQLPWDTKMDRRGFVGVGLTASAILGMLSACDENIFTTKTAREVDINESPELQRTAPDGSLQAHQQSVESLMFSTDSKSLFSSSFDKTVKQWSIPDGKLMATVKEKSLQPSVFGISADGSTLATNTDSAVHLWAVPKATLSKEITVKSPSYSRKLVFAPDGQSFAVTTENSVDIHSISDGSLKASLKGFENKAVFSLAFTPNSQMLLTTTNGEDVKVWSSADGNLISTLAQSTFLTDVPRQVIFTPDSLTMGTVIGGQLESWTLSDGTKSTKALKDYDIRNLLLTPDGKSAITFGRYVPPPEAEGSPPDYSNTASGIGQSLSFKIRTFPEMEDVTVGKLRAEQGSSFITSESAKLKITADGKTLAAAFHNGTSIWLLSVPDLTLACVLKGRAKTIQTFAISPDGKYLAAGDYGGSIMLWDLEAKEFLSYFFDKAANTSSVKGVAYNVTDKVTGRTITYTLPCGSPIPPGAICTCNCVPGTYTIPRPPRAPRTTRSSGTFCTCNKICTCIPVPSDREVKESFESTNPETILENLSTIPIRTWNYKWDDASVRHIGPTAQDFAAAFGVGDSDKHIHPVDAQGVALAALQGLFGRMKRYELQIECLRDQLEQEHNEKTAIAARVDALEQLLKEPGKRT